MKRDILVLALSITLLAMCSCAESPLPQPPDNIFVDAGIITRLTETGLPITSAITTTAGTTVTTPPPEVSDEIEAEYSFTFNGKVYKVDLEGTFYQGDIHFFLDEDTLYLVNSVCVPDYDNGMNSNSEYFNLHELFQESFLPTTI